MATSIKLSPDAERRLADLSAHTGRPRDFHLQELVEKGLEDLEDYYLACEVRDRVRAGQEKVYTSTDVRRELGVED
ncbi:MULTISPECIES: CopG family transcriptional regulator [unclassified Ectothiorhodospira]|uniref:type II toxin-antitoxin system RelB family antitoxin n=1 Tax=unclassified Ectothiorhodospira TaxID=2684909 RepID=UPI001EE7C07E|nr:MULTISPECIES: CopG family transcriptional regulator [unclassified Ectothiorhodospira]MCG5516867.1 CopG family transcriptional regulator [Ectothiorhodospira sp. 9100]MCG5519740.1 CopG family transcriptional regulator [Ectothiorhodospira sp. 9905]